MALEQSRLCGPNRFGRLSRSQHTMQLLRDQYGHALLHGQAHVSSPGQTDRPLKLTGFNNGNGIGKRNGNDLGNSGCGSGVMSSAGSVARWDSFARVFDADLFTAWNMQQPRLHNRASAHLYGVAP